MQKQSFYKVLITFLPLIILLFMASYFAKKSWYTYQKSTGFQATLQNVKLLQNYENAILDESLCKAVLPKGSKELSNICQKRIKKSRTLAKMISSRSENLEHWVHQINQIQKNSINYAVSDFEKLLGKSNLTSSDNYLYLSIVL